MVVDTLQQYQRMMAVTEVGEVTRDRDTNTGDANHAVTSCVIEYLHFTFQVRGHGGNSGCKCRCGGVGGASEPRLRWLVQVTGKGEAAGGGAGKVFAGRARVWGSMTRSGQEKIRESTMRPGGNRESVGRARLYARARASARADAACAGQSEAARAD
eukprot:4161590-Pleurochrysis_carterae.AAC.1